MARAKASKALETLADASPGDILRIRFEGAELVVRLGWRYGNLGEWAARRAVVASDGSISIGSEIFSVEDHAAVLEVIRDQSHWLRQGKDSGEVVDPLRRR